MRRGVLVISRGGGVLMPTLSQTLVRTLTLTLALTLTLQRTAVWWAFRRTFSFCVYDTTLLRKFRGSRGALLNRGSALHLATAIYWGF